MEPGDRARVLIVDDRPQGTEPMRAALALAGYEVMTASTSNQALHCIEQDRPDVVLLDVMMPGVNGYELCTSLKSDPRTRLIPVILLAPLDESGGKLRGIEAGCDDFLRRPVNLVELLSRVKSLVRTKRLNEELISAENTILALARAIQAKDPYAQGHLERVADYASALGREIGLSAREQELLRKGGILHDIGKIGIRDAVLLKHGPLTKEEWEHIKTHPVLGETICQPLGEKALVLIIRHHHERYDGKGYPDGLAGEAIPLGARIMAIADAYDALTSDRPHRGRFSPRQALDIMRREARAQFAPALSSRFITLLERRRLP
jgi:putative two-component system response regulator